MSRRKNSSPEFVRVFPIIVGDFITAGSVSITVKNLLKAISLSAFILRRVAIVAFEAEMNALLYGGGGELVLYLSPSVVRLVIRDHGPGIENLPLAMQEGWSTATPRMREMGFGAGMGLPNIKKNSDRFTINTAPGKGTSLQVEIDLL